MLAFRPREILVLRDRVGGGSADHLELMVYSTPYGDQNKLLHRHIWKGNLAEMSLFRHQGDLILLRY